MIAQEKSELDTLREGGRRLAGILAEVVSAVRPGVSTLELDRLAESLILSSGGEPAFKGYRTRKSDPPFPANLCTSVNDEVVHAIPRRDRILREGDIVGLDIGMCWPSASQKSKVPAPEQVRYGVGKSQKFEGGGLITDMAVTVPVGRVSVRARRLLAVTECALAAGIAVLKPGIHLGDLGQAIQRAIEAGGLGVIRELVGHGVGRTLHESPYVPNFGRSGTGPVVREGMVLAIEPMATLGDYRVKLDPDGWTFRTRDGSLAAHFEHTVIVTKDGAEVLTKADNNDEMTI